MDSADEDIGSYNIVAQALLTALFECRGFALKMREDFAGEMQ